MDLSKKKAVLINISEVLKKGKKLKILTNMLDFLINKSSNINLKEVWRVNEYIYC